MGGDLCGLIGAFVMGIFVVRNRELLGGYEIRWGYANKRLPSIEGGIMPSMLYAEKVMTIDEKSMRKRYRN